jgi:hypothetical protein
MAGELPVAVATRRKTARPQGGKLQATARSAAAHPLRRSSPNLAASPLKRYLAHR